MVKFILPLAFTAAFPPPFRWILCLPLFKHKVSAGFGACAPFNSTRAHIQFTRYKPLFIGTPIYYSKVRKMSTQKYKFFKFFFRRSA